MRLWEQGLVSDITIPGLPALIVDHYQAVSGLDELQVDVHGIRDQASEAARAVAGRAVKFVALARREDEAIGRNVVRAESEGYDAVVIGAWQDSGLDEARSLVDIPVIGYGEASLYAGLLVGERLGWVAINPQMEAHIAAVVQRRGLHQRIAPTGYMSCGYDALERGVAGDPAEFVEAFLETARGLVEAGVDVIMPGQTIISDLLWREHITEVEGAPILDPRFWCLRFAEALIEYRRLGFPVSRLGFFRARPDAQLVSALDEYLGVRP